MTLYRWKRSTYAWMQGRRPYPSTASPCAAKHHLWVQGAAWGSMGCCKHHVHLLPCMSLQVCVGGGETFCRQMFIYGIYMDMMIQQKNIFQIALTLSMPIAVFGKKVYTTLNILWGFNEHMICILGMKLSNKKSIESQVLPSLRKSQKKKAGYWKLKYENQRGYFQTLLGMPLQIKTTNPLIKIVVLWGCFVVKNQLGTPHIAKPWLIHKPKQCASWFFLGQVGPKVVSEHELYRMSWSCHHDHDRKKNMFTECLP